MRVFHWRNQSFKLDERKETEKSRELNAADTRRALTYKTLSACCVLIFNYGCGVRRWFKEHSKWATQPPIPDAHIAGWKMNGNKNINDFWRKRNGENSTGKLVEACFHITRRVILAYWKPSWTGIRRTHTPHTPDHMLPHCNPTRMKEHKRTCRMSRH